ncbi:hypothetical protein GCM10027088_08930 [Nocardia goodfellowii]
MAKFVAYVAGEAVTGRMRVAGRERAVVVVAVTCSSNIPLVISEKGILEEVGAADAGPMPVS